MVSRHWSESDNPPEVGFCRQRPDLIPRNVLGRLHKEGRIWDAVLV